MSFDYRVCPKCGCRAPVLFSGQDPNHCRSCDGPYKETGFSVEVEVNETKTKWRVTATAPGGQIIFQEEYPDQETARRKCEVIAVGLKRLIDAAEGFGARA